MRPSERLDSEAVKRWPAKASLFDCVKDDGRAEAALIALAGLLKDCADGRRD